jgi:hypothetical protein
MSKVSDLGMDARLGWFPVHPDTGARMEGRAIPFWEESKALALAAHQHFDDRIAWT